MNKLQTTNKKAAIPIAIIFSIIITVVGIALVFSFFGSKISITQKAYCKSIEPLRESLGGTRNSICDKYLEIDINQLDAGTDRLDAFLDGEKRKFLRFDGHNTKTVEILLPKNSIIKKADFVATLEPEEIRTFTNEKGQTKTTDYMIIPRGGNIGSEQIFKVKMPDDPNYLIMNASIEINGRNKADMATIVFILDTSGSMGGEWSSVCTLVEAVGAILDDEYVDYGGKIPVLALGSGDADYVSCETGVITEDQIREFPYNEQPYKRTYFACGKYFPETNTVANDYDGKDSGRHSPTKVYDGGYKCADAGDDYEEAWGNGILSITKNIGGKNSVWSLDQRRKRILIPISDADPTGSTNIALTEYYHNQKDFKAFAKSVYYLCTDGGMPETGSETPVINSLIQRCKQNSIHVYPIMGDDICHFNKKDGSPEYFRKNYKTRIISEMNKIAQATGGKTNNYTDTYSILNTIIDALGTPYPKDLKITLSCGGPVTTLTFPGSTNISNSPKIAKANKATLDSCIGKIMTIKIGSAKEGSAMINALSVKYIPKAVNIDVGSDTVSLSSDYRSETFNITQYISSKLTACTTPMCKIEIPVSSNTDALISTRIDIEYINKELEDILFEKIISCWKKANYGRLNQNTFCEEFILPKSYTYTSPITESVIAKKLIERNICRLLGSKRNGCGTKNNIVFKKTLNNDNTILIEYIYNISNSYITIS